MRKVLITAGALLFCATPAAAQQQTLAQADQPTPVREAAAAPDPTFFPTTDQVKEDVRQNEDRIGQAQAQVGSKSWWYLVAAVAIGVIIAAVVL